MAKQRKTAPKIDVSRVHISERLVTEQTFDKKFKDYKHMWVSVDATQEKLSAQNKEIVHDEDGNIITNGISQLVRQPASIYYGAVKAKEELSRARVESMNQNEDGSTFIDDELTVTSNPKRRKAKDV